MAKCPLENKNLHGKIGENTKKTFTSILPRYHAALNQF